MLHEILAQYLARVEQAMLRCRNAYVEHYTEEILTPQRANLRIRLRFEQGHLLEINEAVVVVEDRLFRLITAITARMNIIVCFFASDSTPHFPGLPNSCLHKHLSDDVIGCEKPDVEQVVQEAMEAQG